MATTTQPSECPILNAWILLTINGYRVGNSYIVLELSRIISSLEPGFTIISNVFLVAIIYTIWVVLGIPQCRLLTLQFIIKHLYIEVTSYVKLFTILIFIFKIYLVLLYISYTDKKKTTFFRPGFLKQKFTMKRYKLFNESIDKHMLIYM